ncbi:hypothetical protein BgAZ_500230 [Babesia gibsoni]|uniref:SWIM-type domain-containing protein n=1 Tax=Babesia gibsoni TaxID=33632 RepID=A0AAD8PD47_BABGI|nr:hypothetical protein BgAZ_500230 [Babesia gibsoni]
MVASKKKPEADAPFDGHSSLTLGRSTTNAMPIGTPHIAMTKSSESKVSMPASWDSETSETKMLVLKQKKRRPFIEAWPTIRHPHGYADPRCTNEPYDPWEQYLKRQYAFNKARVIVNSHQLPHDPSLDCNMHKIYSRSKGIRTVDMLLFECDCPNGVKPCSHLIAAAMNGRSEHNYFPKLVIMTEIEKRIRHYMQVFNVKSLNSADLQRIAGKFINPKPTDDIVQLLLQILVGISYRSLQNKRKYGVYARQLLDKVRAYNSHQNSDENGFPDEDTLSKVLALLHHMDMNTSATEVEASTGDTGKTTNSEPEPVNPKVGKYDMYHSCKHVFIKICSLMRSLSGAYNPAMKDDMDNYITVVHRLVNRMLAEEFDMGARDGIDKYHIKTAIKEAAKLCEFFTGDPLVIDAYVVGYDCMIDDVRSPICTASSTENYRKMKNRHTQAMLLQQIIELPMVEDVHKYTMWELSYRESFGSLKQFLVENGHTLANHMTFLTLPGGAIIKIPPTKSVSSPTDPADHCNHLYHMKKAMDERDCRSFVAYGLSHLAKVKKCRYATANPLSTHINDTFFKDSSDAGADFMSECINIMPEILILPFFIAFMSGTRVVTEGAVGSIALFMNEAILRGRMSSDIKIKLFILGAFFNLDVETEWKRASRLADVAFRRIAKAAKEREKEVGTEEMAEQLNDGGEVTCGKPSQHQDGAIHHGDSSYCEGDIECKDNSPHSAGHDAPWDETEEELLEIHIGHTDINTKDEALVKEHPPSPSKEHLLLAEDSTLPILEPKYANLHAGKALIDEIRRTEFGVDIINEAKGRCRMQSTRDGEILKILEKHRKRVARSIKRLSEDLYNNRIHLQLELLQNADDNEYDSKTPEILFLLDPHAIVVMNNERGFTEKDVRSLCDIAATSKTDISANKTGKFGIGFKSVFLITETPHVFSNGYHFFFSSDPNLENNTEYIMPHWVDISNNETPYSFVGNRISAAGWTALQEHFHNAEDVENPITNTILYLPLKDGIRSYGLDTFYSDFQAVSQLHLPFLRKLQKITFIDVANCHRTTLTRALLTKENYKLRIHPKGPETGSSRLMQSSPENDYEYLLCQQVALIEEKYNAKCQTNRNELKIFLIDYEFSLNDIEMDFISISKSQKRERKVTVGIPILGVENLRPNFCVYNVLPIGNYGLQFLVNGDFVISTSRQAILDDDPWNALLARKAADAFSYMMCLIVKEFIAVDNLYSSTMHAIPRIHSVHGCFEECCRRIHQHLTRMKWVATINGETTSPSKALIIPDKICITAAREDNEVIRSLLPPELLIGYCGVKYADPVTQAPTLRDTLLELGMQEVSPPFVAKVLKDVRKEIDMSLPLKNQPILIQDFISNIGLLICMLDRMGTPEEVHNLRRSLILLDSCGMPMVVNETTMFTRDRKALGSMQIDNLVNPELFNNKWGIHGYANRISGVLELLGCFELTPMNAFSTVVMRKVRTLLDTAAGLSPHDILIQGKHILHILVANVDKWDTLTPEDLELIRSTPVLLDDGTVTPLNDSRIRFCPDTAVSSDLGCITQEIGAHFVLVRKFFEGINAEIKYISNDYLEGVTGNDSHNNGVTFRNMQILMNHIGVFTFLRYRHIDLQAELVGNYEVRDMVEAGERAVHLCNTKRKINMFREDACKTKKMVRDWYSSDFLIFSELLHKCYTTKTRSNQSATGSSDHCMQAAYDLSIAMYNILNFELSSNSQYISATIDPLGNPQVLGKSLFYYQLHAVPWLPYKKATTLRGNGNDVIWHPVLPIAVNDYVACDSIFFIKLDSVVTNELLAPQQTPDVQYVLDFLCNEIRKIIENADETTSSFYGFKTSNQLPGETEPMYPLRVCFAKEKFLSLINDDIATLKTAMTAIYLRLYSKMKEDTSFALTMCSEFRYKKRVLTFCKQRNSPGIPEVPLLCTSCDPRLSVYGSIIEQDSLPLQEAYADLFDTLEEFWHIIGVSEFTSVEETLRLIKDVETLGNQTDLERLFACIMHLYNITDNATFVKTLWNVNCIPATYDLKYMFKFETDTEICIEKRSRVKLVAPSSCLVTLKSPNSVSMAQLLQTKEKAFPWVVMCPVKANQAVEVTRYMCKYFKSMGITKSQLWQRILVALKATDFVDHMALVPTKVPVADSSKWPLGRYALILLLPYFHHYMKFCGSIDYTLCCKRLKVVLNRLDICVLFNDIMAEYHYLKANEEIRGNPIETDALLHCDINGVIHFYVTVKDIPEFFSVDGEDIIHSARRLSESRRLVPLPTKFFECLARLLLSDPWKCSWELNSHFLRSTEHERHLAGYLSTVYEMMRLQSKDAVDLFVRSYSRGDPLSCICNEYYSNLESSKDGGTAEGDYAYGSHIPTDTACKDGVADPFVNMLLAAASGTTYCEDFNNNKSDGLSCSSGMPQGTVGIGSACNMSKSSDDMDAIDVRTPAQDGIESSHIESSSSTSEDVSGEDSHCISLVDLQMRTQEMLSHQSSPENIIGDHSQVILYNSEGVAWNTNWQVLPYMRARNDVPMGMGPMFALIEVIEPLKYFNNNSMRKRLEAASSYSDNKERQRGFSIGLLGEEYVYNVLRAILKEEIAKGDLDVIWHNQDSEGGQAYDITVTNRKGEDVYIEVKSSASLNRPSFSISYAQWVFAQQHRFRFEIFRLSGIGQRTPKLVRLMNPYSMYKEGNLKLLLTL